MYALRTSLVLLRSVAWGVSEVNTTTLPARTGTSTDSAQSPQHSSPTGVVRCTSVPSRCTPRHHGDAAVVVVRVVDRDPARQVRLRLDVRVAVVLVPEDGRGAVGLLVDRLVPVEAHVGPDQVARDAGELRSGDELAQVRAARNGVGRHGLGVEARDAEAPVGRLGEEFLHLGVTRRELGVDARERAGVEHVLQHEEPELVELARLLSGDRRALPGVVLPGECRVPRVRRPLHHRRQGNSEA